MSQVLFDDRGQRVLLGKELARGGEGAVYNLETTNDYVAKLYLSPITQEKAQKLKHMTSCQLAELAKFAAWPRTTLRQHPNDSIPLGFIMQRLPKDGQAIHQIYNIKSRMRQFPNANWSFLVATAMNCATAFETLHAQGHVVGDINAQNVVVSQRATVFLIDCDSYQIKVNGNIHRCEVGVPEYTAPELHNQDFSQVNRTSNHDNFGLAVLIFQLLFMRHPFSGKFIGRGDPPELPQLIQSFRFPFGRNARQYQLEPPPNWPTLEYVTPGMQEMFERAFAQASVGNGRPTATDWRLALENLKQELHHCEAEDSHHYYRKARTCPWCESASKAGVEFFVTLTYADNKVVAAVFASRIEVLNEFRRQFLSLQIDEDQIGRASNVPRVVIPPFPSIAPPPTKTEAPVAPIIPCAPQEPKFLERDQERKKFKRFVIIGIFASVLAVPGAVLCFATWGFQPLPFMTTLAVFGCWLAWAFTLYDHRYWKFNRQFERQVQEYKDDCIQHPHRMSEYNRALEVYEADSKRYADERREYDARYSHYQRLKAQYDDRKAAYIRTLKEIDLDLAQCHQNRLQLQEKFQRYQVDFAARKNEIQKHGNRHQGLKPECDAELNKLSARAREEQLKVYLEDINLNDPKYRIPKVGKGRLSSLAANGISTAWDLTEDHLIRVPNFGRVLCESMVAWRRDREREFKFDPTSGVPVAVSAAIVRTWQRQQRAIETDIKNVVDKTRIEHSQMMEQISAVKARAGQFSQKLQIAMENLQSLTKGN